MAEIISVMAETTSAMAEAIPEVAEGASATAAKAKERKATAAGQAAAKRHQQKKDHLSVVLRAENETRTRDPNLGKVVLYQLSYFRLIWRCKNTNFFFSTKLFLNFFY